VDGIAEVCSDERDGLIVPPRDLKGFCSSLERIITNPVLRRNLGGNARRTILDRYEINLLARRIESVYDELSDR